MTAAVVLLDAKTLRPAPPARRRRRKAPRAAPPLRSLAELVAAGALFVCNHSGGKDSQAMLLYLLAAGVPAAQILVVHATLGEVEWPGALEHAREHAAAHGVAFLLAAAPRTFLEMVARRRARRPGVPSWPDAGSRQCTSDLKRGPIEREVRRYAAARGLRLIVNCMGMRAAESPARAAKAVWSFNGSQSVAGREWWNWLPVHHLSTPEVFALIAAAGERPHWAYAAGNERLSCMFCILGSAADARNAAVHNPELFARYVATEAATGYTMHAGRGLEAFAGITVAEAHAVAAARAAGAMPAVGARRRLPVVQAAPPATQGCAP